MVEQWQRSGQTASAFCAQHDIATATFSGWRAETRSRTAAKGFVEINLPSAPTGKEARGSGTVPEVVVVHDHFRVELSGSTAVSFVARVVAALTGGS